MAALLRSRLLPGAALWLALLGLRTAEAGGTPYNTLVVVNRRSPLSRRIADYYCRKRSIPAINVVHTSVPRVHDLDFAVFEERIRQPILHHLDKYDLRDQIGYIVFCGDFPYRVWKDKEVQDGNSLCAVMFYGYHNSPPPCSLPVEARSRYYRKGWGFPRWEGFRQIPCFITALLTGWSDDQAKWLIDRSVAADAAAPSGTVYFVHTPDFDRNKRWTEFEEAARQIEFSRSPVQTQIISDRELQGKHDVVGYMLGAYNPKKLASNRFLPGALGDHFTSWGGYLYDSSWQMSVLDWISNGCVGTYGTTMEPCSYRQKFAEPQLFAWYVRGYTMGESYCMAISHPYQGVLVGDPLCAPYAVPPVIEAELVQDEKVGSVGYRVKAADPYHPVARLEFYLEGRRVNTITNILPEPGNEVVVEIGKITNLYTVRPGDLLCDIVREMANIIERSNPNIAVEIWGDRLILLEKTWEPGRQPIAYRAYSRRGSAARLTVRAWATGTNLVTGEFPARQVAMLQGKPGEGDRLKLLVHTVAGSTTTGEVVAAKNDTTVGLLAKLQRLLKEHPVLSGPDGVSIQNIEQVKNRDQVVFSVVANRSGPLGAATRVELTVQKSGRGSDLTGGYTGFLTWNARTLVGRGEVQLACGVDCLEGRLDAAGWRSAASGDIALVAFDGTAAACSSWKVVKGE